MLTKIALFCLVVFLVYIFFFKNKRKVDIQEEKAKNSRILEGDTMVECKQCATFISHKEAIIVDGAFYCSKECARLPR